MNEKDRTNDSGLTIIIQSTDSFSDCWSPFFTLLSNYWPGCEYPIILNTETMDFSYPDLQITSSKISRLASSNWPTWSETVIFCLEHLVETEIVLLWFDDFFPSGPVDVHNFRHCLQLMRNNDYACITLAEHGLRRPTVKFEHPFLLSVHQRAKYRLSAGPSLWRVSALRRYLRPEENAWQFEVFGSCRARKRKDVFLTVNTKAFPEGQDGIIPYFQASYDTGIVKGKWQREIKPFFEDHNIEVDYSIRGFYKPLPSILNKYYIITKLLKNPKLLIKGVLGI